MGRYEIKDGSVLPQNMQSGRIDVTVDENGDGTTTVPFKRTFKKIPVVQLTPLSRVTTGVYSVETTTVNQVMVSIDNSSTTGGVVTIGYTAFDDPR